MELCDLSLEKYIYRTSPPAEIESVPYFVRDAKPPLKTLQICNVMIDILSGLEYIHALKEVLKPANGEPHLSP